MELVPFDDNSLNKFLDSNQMQVLNDKELNLVESIAKGGILDACNIEVELPEFDGESSKILKRDLSFGRLISGSLHPNHL